MLFESTRSTRPTEWTVKRIDTRRWYVVDHRGATIATRTTKKAAHAAIDRQHRTPDLGRELCVVPRRKHRSARSADHGDEQAIVGKVLAEIDSAMDPAASRPPSWGRRTVSGPTPRGKFVDHLSVCSQSGSAQAFDPNE